MKGEWEGKRVKRGEEKKRERKTLKCHEVNSYKIL